MKNKFSLWCQVIWNVFIFVFLLFVFGNLIQRRVVGISVGAEELFFLILIPIFLLINLKPTFVNIKKYNINNGFVEGKNNKIKVIKRISYGIKKFDNLKKLIQLRIS